MTDDLAEILHQEIDRLPERHRSVVVLCDLEERSYEEAARHLRCPVGTVQSRLARARERLRAALGRRGIAPAVIPLATSRGPAAAPEQPPQALTSSTIRGSVLFACDPTGAPGVVSKKVIQLSEGALRTMIRSRLQTAVLVTLASLSLIIPAWLAHARQAAGDRPRAQAPAAGRENAVRPVDLEGNWIVRGYPSGQAFALIRFEGPEPQLRATVLSVARPDGLAGSKVERLRADDKTVRFRIRNQAERPMDVIAYRLGHRASREALWGSMDGFGRGSVFPAKLERTDKKELDRAEGRAPGPGTDELQRLNQTKDHAQQKEILLGMLDRFGDTPMAPLAAWVLAINEAETAAPNREIRALIDQAARIGGRYGREMEIGAINIIVSNIVGQAEREDLTIEYARKALAMLETGDSVSLRRFTMTNLVNALRKATRIDEAKAEVDALEEQISRLRDPADESKPSVNRDSIPWARNFAAARRQARAEGKPIMVDFFTVTCGWCKRLDSEVFPRPPVAEAMRPFVPVKVNAEDGEGKPLVERYQAHIRGYPTILFLDPAIEDPRDARIVGKIPGFMPASSFAEQLNAISRLPRDVRELLEKVHPDDGDAMRRVAMAMAMQGRVKEAVALIDRAWGAGADPNFDRWAAVYNTLGDEVMLHLKLEEASGWFDKAARVAKRPIDVYNAHAGGGFVAMMRNKADEAIRELEAAARVDGVSSTERDFAKELLGMLAKPPAGIAAVPEAAAALQRLQSESPKKGNDRSP
jgi:thioredoxin-related protein